MFLSFCGKKPRDEGAAFVAPSATVQGDVILKPGSTVWYGAVLRGDDGTLTIGKNSNVQDNAVLHCDIGGCVTLGENVTVGHCALVHGCTVGDGSLIGMHATLLNHCVVGKNCIIGAGALVAEIQESSNLTYRLYDYDRVGKDGKKRELHIDKALDVANLHSSVEPKQPLRVLKYRQGIASELLTRCKYFEVYRMIVNTERRQKVHYRADEIAFRVLLCVNGCGTISYEDGNLPFYKGDCIFVPADSEVLTIHGQAQFLDVRG